MSPCPTVFMTQWRRTNDTSDGAAIREAVFPPSIPTALEGLVATVAYAWFRAHMLREGYRLIFFLRCIFLMKSSNCGSAVRPGGVHVEG